MYEIFEKLLKEKDITAYKVGKETGIGGSTFTDWKNGRSKPGPDKLIKIAKCLGVTVEYLTTGQDSQYSDENAHLLAKIRNDTKLTKALHKYFSLSDVKKKHIIELINLLSK